VNIVEKNNEESKSGVYEIKNMTKEEIVKEDKVATHVTLEEM
jgi:hypothetical protein